MDVNRPYCLEWPQSLQKIAEALKEKQFSTKRDEGFLLDRVQQNRIEGRFIQRVQKLRTIRDPLGNEFTSELLEFRETRFICDDSQIALQIFNPAVGWKRIFFALNSALHDTLQFGVTKVNPLAWHAALSVESEFFKQPISLQAAPVEVDYGAMAAVRISGMRKVIDACDTFLAEFPYQALGVEYRFKNVTSIRVIISDDGSYQVSSSASKDLRELLDMTRLRALNQ